MSDDTGFDSIGEYQNLLAALLSELQKGARQDRELLRLVGSLGASLTREADMKNWPTVKSALTPEAYDSLLATFQNQGNELSKAGNQKAATAVNVMALSLIGSRISDLTISEGVAILDDFIGFAMQTFLKDVDKRRERASRKKPSDTRH